MDKLYRFKLASLDGIDEPTVIDYLANQFQLREEQITRFLAGKFVFKPCSEPTVEKSIKLLATKGIKCSKHQYVKPDTNVTSEQLEIRELKFALEKARQRIAELEAQLQAPMESEHTEDDVKEFMEALENGMDDTLAGEEKDSSDTQVAEQSENTSAEKESTTKRKKPFLWLASGGLAATVAMAGYLFFGTEKEIVMDYSGFAQRNNISVEDAKALAETLGSISVMTEYEIDAKRRKMDMSEYLKWRPYAEQCKENKAMCKNAEDFVTVHLDGSFVMNQYRANCEEYVRMKQESQVQYSPNAFAFYDKSSTAFKDNGRLTLTAEAQIKDDAGMWRDHSIYCQVDTASARIHGINIL
ncbi:MAG: hypothetical protein ACFHVJ_16960 [Aestuariibacter sp.]